MFCKRLTGKFQFTLQPIAGFRSPSVSATPVFLFSNDTKTDSANSDTSQDSGHLSDTQTMSITRLVGSPRYLLPGPSAGDLIATSQRKYCYSESAASNAGSVGVL